MPDSCGFGSKMRADCAGKPHSLVHDLSSQPNQVLAAEPSHNSIEVALNTQHMTEAKATMRV